MLAAYNYEAVYEHIGRDYNVVGNPGIMKDREGFGLRGGTSFGVHGVNLSFSRYNDNVRNDELFPRIVSYEAVGDYSFNGIPGVPLGLNYRKAIQETDRIPQGGAEMKLHTDTITGRAGYSAGQLNLNLQVAHSLMDDQGPANNDSTLMNYNLMASYNLQNFSLNPNIQINRSTNKVTDISTNTYTLVLDLRSKWFNDRIGADIGGTYSINKTSDKLMDMRNLMANFRLTYYLKNIVRALTNPSFGLRGTYTKITDRISHASDRDEFALFFVFATAMPFSL
jgi:hypothetical protein